MSARLWPAVLICLTGCDAWFVAPPETPQTRAPDCDAGDDAFVAQATLAILGRRPLSRAEVEAGAQAIAAVDAIDGKGAGRRAFALSLTSSPDFGDRWSQHVMDAMFVSRTGVQSLAGCYDVRDRDDDDGTLAAFVRDNASLDGTEPGGAFTYDDLLRSSLVLDDLSPIYRAQMFAMLTTPNQCGNVDPVQQELATRDEVGAAFDAAYLDRDPVCLQCHNAEASVTDRPDPAEDRHWPLPGSLEAAVFGDSFSVDPKVADAPFRTTDFLGGGGGGFDDFDYTQGYCFDGNNLTPALCDGGTAGCADGSQSFCAGYEDPQCDADGKASCANAPFCISPDFQNADTQIACVDGAAACATAMFEPFCADGDVPACNADGSFAPCPNPGAGAGGEGEGEGGASGFTPWGADPACGTFSPDVPDDPADVDGRLASVRGKRATVIQLEAALHRGVDSLATRGLIVHDDGRVDGPDEAFAYLVAAHVVDGVWREVMGSPLTIATHFPRNQAARDVLKGLTDDFVHEHSSLKTLLADIVTSPYFNLKSPDEGCGAPYALEPVLDPWVRTEPDEAMRKNSPADGVHVLSGRTLLRAAYAALGWPHPDNESFPEGNGNFDQTCLDFPDCASLQSECMSNGGHCCAELEALGCAPPAGAALSEIDLQRGLGIFHGFSEKGFRGVDFQVRLTWESRFGRCQKPPGVAHDYVDDLVAQATARGASLGDAVSAMKERFIGESDIDDDEAQALATLDGDLRRGVSGIDAAGNLRVVCGVLLSTPQFQLAGLPPKVGAASTSTARAALVPTAADACADLAARGLPGYDVACSDAGTPTLTKH